MCQCGGGAAPSPSPSDCRFIFPLKRTLSRHKEVSARATLVRGGPIRCAPHGPQVRRADFAATAARCFPSFSTGPCDLFNLPIRQVPELIEALSRIKRGAPGTETLQAWPSTPSYHSLGLGDPGLSLMQTSRTALPAANRDSGESALGQGELCHTSSQPKALDMGVNGPFHRRGDGGFAGGGNLPRATRPAHAKAPVLPTQHASDPGHGKPRLAAPTLAGPLLLLENPTRAAREEPCVSSLYRWARGPQ